MDPGVRFNPCVDIGDGKTTLGLVRPWDTFQFFQFQSKKKL